MKKYFSVLKSCPMFDGIMEEELGAMLACLGARIISLKKGEVIFQEGDEATVVGIVLSGSVRMVREDYYGNRSILTTMRPAELFGETYSLAGISSLPVSILAAEDSECMLIDCRRITFSCANACAFHSRVVFNLLSLVANKNLTYDQKIEVVSKRTTRDKLMTYLMNQAKLNHSSSFVIPYDRQELADYLEVDRSGLSAEISKLRKEGIIECEKSKFTILG